MAFDNLPEEILVRILSFLPRSDLLESALTCRRWAQAVAGSPLLRNVWLVIEDMEEAGPVFANTRRQYENLRISSGDLPDFDAAFWTNVGPSLRKLELLSLCSSDVFHSILKACCNLESLRLGDYYSDSLLLGLAPCMNVRSVQESMRKLHHLHLNIGGPYIDTLEYLLVLMPNVSSVGLRLFYSEPNDLSRLPNILGTSRRITMLELVWTDGIGEEVEQFLRTSSASLRELRLTAYLPLLSRTFEALEYCSMIRDLSIDCEELDVRLLQKILGYVPQLESLTIRTARGSPLTRGDLVPLFDLKKLRELHLTVKLESDSRSCISEELLREIARMLSLETLAVQRGVVDRTGFQILASLPKLRNLELKFVEWNAECLKMIVFESRNLITLSICGNSHLFSRYSPPAGDSEVDPQSLASVDRFGSDGQDELESSSLEALKLSYIPLTDACLGHIAAHHTRLKVLHFTYCDFITDAGLVTLLQHEPLLEELVLYERNYLNDEFLEALGELPCRRLRSLRVRSWKAVSSQAREAFILRKPRMRFFP